MAKILAPLAVSVVLSLTTAQTAQAQFGLQDMVKSATDGLTSSESDPAVEPLDVPHSKDAYEAEFKNYEKTILQGAGIGAIAGGVAGYALGGSEEAVAIGAAVGGAAGALVGKEIAKRSKKITKNRKRLTKALEKSEKKREAALTLLSMTEENIVDLETRITELQNAYNKGNLTVEAKAVKVTQMRALAVEMTESVAKVEADLSKEVLIMDDAAAKLLVHEEPEMQARVIEVQAESSELGDLQTVAIGKLTQLSSLDSKLVAFESG